MSEAGRSAEGSAGPPRRRPFRWQSLFEQVADPLFVLNRRRRILYVNPAGAELAGLPADEIEGLACRRPRPAAATDTPEDILAHALTPPPEVLEGQTAHARRLLPGRGTASRWWAIDFFPLQLAGDGAGRVILGRVQLVAPSPIGPATQLPERLVALRELHASRCTIELLDGHAPTQRRLATQVRLAARLTTPVLLQGERGAGKRTVARIIYDLGPARDRGLAVLDCERLPAASLAAVLFGDRPGSGATPGSIYLAEPAALPRDLQLRLCEALARGPDARGGLPRIFAGMSRDPRQAVVEGTLLDELRCALSPLVIEVMPLRTRGDELPRLVERLLERASADGERKIAGLTDSAWELIRAGAWPGNLAELYDVLATACRHATSDRIDVADLPASLRLAARLSEQAGPTPERVIPLDKTLEQAERRLLELALRRARGNKTRAAELLSIWRPRLIRRMEALGIADGEAPATDTAP